MSVPILRCHGVGVVYPNKAGAVPALEDLTFDVQQNEFLSIVGPSGCGKTTLLRALAGLLPLGSGNITFGNVETNGAPRTSVVFQEKSLFPWMTVLENAAFGLEMQHVPRPERERRAKDILARFGLAGREHAYPRQLSAGMKQRVAVTRAFLSGSPVLLMDEPFGALDCQTRWMAQQELIGLWQQDRKTVVFVTHDVDEAILLSDRILVLSKSPGTVVSEYDVPFSRPRTLLLETGPQVMSLKRRVLASLQLMPELAAKVSTQ